MLNGQRVIVVLPAYNAAATLRQTVAGIDQAVVDDLLVVDDASADDTVAVARSLGVDTYVHDRNRGYGANQKTCYREALARGADIVVMVHADYQYSPRLVVALAAMIAWDEYDMVLGSRVLAQDAVARGMPRYKYVANRALTAIENRLVTSRFSEFHTGLRAYRAALLARLPLDRNSDDFVFDNEVILQALAAHARIGELSCPTRYAAGASSIAVGPSVRYGLQVLQAGWRYRRHRSGRGSYPFLDVQPAETDPR